MTYSNVGLKSSLSDEDKKLVESINSYLFKLGLPTLTDTEVKFLLVSKCNLQCEGECRALYATAFLLSFRMPKCNFYIRNELKAISACLGCNIDFDSIFDKNRVTLNYCRQTC